MDSLGNFECYFSTGDDGSVQIILQLRFLPQRVVIIKFSKCLLKAYHMSILMLLAAEDTKIYKVPSFLCELVDSILKHMVFKTHETQCENLC